MDQVISPALVVESAILADVPGIVGVYADDQVGHASDGWTEERREIYERGFHAIMANPGIELYVARRGGQVAGVIQVLFVPHISNLGATRCILESVFVSAAARGQGVGAAMIAFAEERARARGAQVVSLSSNGKRLDAHRFYERHGYAKSHVAFRKKLG